ncbi:DNA polymerase lambda [Mycena amicta]|nr:DNA polymerase lambda [Mycena amicta]
MKLQIQWKQQQNPDQKRRTASASKPGAGPGVVAVLPKADDIISVSSSSSSSRPASPHARPAPEPKPITAKRKTKTKAPKPPAPLPKTKKSGTKGKEKEVQVKLLPPAYAQMLLDKLKENPNDPLIKQESARLEGCTVFYIGDDMTVALTKTKGCMAMIIRLGGTLAPVFDPQTVTHIVCEGALPTAERALKVKNIAEVPDEIPIVRWSWVLKGGQLFEHAAFAKRVPPIEGIAPVKGKGKGKERAPSVFSYPLLPPKRSTPQYSEDEDSDAERARHAPPPKKRPSKGQQPPAQASSSSADPLAEFHELALANRRAVSFSDCSRSNLSLMSVFRKVWSLTRKTRGSRRTRRCVTAVERGNPNQFIIDKLQELSDVHEAKAGEGDGWRVYTYRKVLRAMGDHTEPIETYADAMKLPFVADKTAKKIVEIVQTGDLRRIKYENTPDVRIKKLFQGIYGVGPATAQKFYNSGSRTLADLLTGKGEVVLTEAQKIGIEFYDDINSRMPREEAQALFDIIKPVALKIDPKLEVHIMGSFRRGKSTCGDIDIMITRDPADGKAHNGILHFLLKALHKEGIITEDLALPEDPFDEEAIYRGLCRLPGNPDAKRRRIDFLTVPWKSRGAALMYYTGDDIFNRKMRFKAGKMGYSLNQKGLFAGVVRNPSNRTEKINAGNIIAGETEEEIFKILGVPFRLPHERAGKEVSVYRQ